MGSFALSSSCSNAAALRRRVRWARQRCDASGSVALAAPSRGCVLACGLLLIAGVCPGSKSRAAHALLPLAASSVRSVQEIQQRTIVSQMHKPTSIQGLGRRGLSPLARRARRNTAEEGASESRRAAAMLLPVGVFATWPVHSADAFENETPESKNYPLTRNRVSGVRPSDLGLEYRRLSGFGPKARKTSAPALKGCPPKATDCFSTTADPQDSSVTTLLQPWRPPAGTTPADAMVDIRKVVINYPPGQNGVDAGGFRLAEVKREYLYVQFQALQGQIDDVEWAAVPDGTVLVRSATRPTDNSMGGILNKVEGNAKRLNYVSAELRKLGWTADEVTASTHPYYFKANEANV